ncbi:ccr4 associated factor [Coemansia aciculifera]|nr:ccr4 associated factor [Coemansia aciculifera]
MLTTIRGARTILTALGRRRQFSTGSRRIHAPSTTELCTGLDAQASYAAVTGRSVISVSGADASTFLQGMQCNDMVQASDGGMFTGFLAPQGRMVADAFVYTVADGFLIEVDARVSGRVLKALQFYRLRAKVTIRDMSAEHTVWSVWGPDTPSVSATGAAAGAEDRRAPLMGQRLVMPVDHKPSLPAQFEERSDSEAKMRRILKGVAEGADDFVPGVSVPLECNLDYMGGVHFSKGCYVGQELTIRTHHRGIVRKRLLPLLLGPMTSPVCADPDASLIGLNADGHVVCMRADDAPRPRRPQAPGRIGSIAGNAALALLRLDDVAAYEKGEVSFEAVAADGSRISAAPWTLKPKPAAAAAPTEGTEEKHHKYRCRDLKRQLDELEEYNELLAIKLFRSQKRLRRMKIERNILLERFERTHHGGIDDSASDSDSDAPLKNTFPRPVASDSEPAIALRSASPAMVATPTARGRRKGVQHKTANNPPSSSASTPLLPPIDATTPSHTSTGRKPRSDKDPNAPKRPANAFVLYCQDERPSIKSAGTDLTSGDLTRALAVTWKGLPQDEKQKYYDLYEREMNRYNQEFARYKSTLHLGAQSAVSEASTAVAASFADASSRDDDMDVDIRAAAMDDDDGSGNLNGDVTPHSTATATAKEYDDAPAKSISVSAEPSSLDRPESPHPSLPPVNGRTHTPMSHTSASPPASSPPMHSPSQTDNDLAQAFSAKVSSQL